MTTEWTVKVLKRAEKNLSKKAAEALIALILDLRNTGPVRGDWPNYSKLGSDGHHCHLVKGRPTYVACWRVADRINKIIEVYYAGTHENAPY